MERMRILGGEFVKSIAVAGRTGGVRATGGPVGSLAAAVLGEAVCARGGGGGAAGLSSSDFTFETRTSTSNTVHRTLSRTHVLVDPSFEIFIVIERRLFSKVGFHWRWGIAAFPKTAEPT